MTTAWLVIAGAVLLLPATRPSIRSARQPATEPSPVVLPGAVALAALACIAIGGAVAGGAVAALGCPVLWAALARLRGRPRPPADDPQLPIALDLIAAALHGGRPSADALARGARAAGPVSRAGLEQVAGLLRLGAEPAQAWTAVGDGPLEPVAVVAVRSAASGIRVAAAFEDLAHRLRAERQASGAERAHRAGVRAMGPLAACFLPSFVCLGIVPVVVGIARQALEVVP